MSIVELHCHSAYSFLDGASLPEELAVQAAELGYEALALTDHDGLYGSLEFAHAAKALGVRPITGAELTLLDGSHVTVLVESQRGYANLCRLVTAAHAGTRPPGRESQPPGDPALDPGVLAELNEGLIVLSGCARRGARRAKRESRGRARSGLPRPLLRRAAAALRARRRAPERGAARPGGDARRADGRDRRRPRALAPPRLPAGRARGDPQPRAARGRASRSGAGTTRASSSRRPSWRSGSPTTATPSRAPPRSPRGARST